MADEPEQERTFKEKLLFYTTAFFILLGTFSLFAFLFLVPFVIDPAFTTIFMQFDEEPALCVTVETEHLRGASNCSWASCREGCTKEVYECTQIRVNYKLLHAHANRTHNTTQQSIVPQTLALAPSSAQLQSHVTTVNENKNTDGTDTGTDTDTDTHARARVERAIREYDYAENVAIDGGQMSHESEQTELGIGYSDMLDIDGTATTADGVNTSEWFFTGARLFPNVKGCGYPPMLNCSIWLKKYKTVGTNFSCYYSRVEPALVVSDLDMWQNTLKLVYAMAIPIPSFIISVIYLTIAYFKIYNEDEETAPLDKNAEAIAGEGEDEDRIGGGVVSGDNADDEDDDGDDGDGDGDDDDGDEDDDDEAAVLPGGGETGSEECDDDALDSSSGVGGGANTNGIIRKKSKQVKRELAKKKLPNGKAKLATSVSGTLTPNTDLAASFGHQLKVQMADEMSRESIDGGLLSNSGSVQGNLSKTMTTSISTPPGPIAAV